MATWAYREYYVYAYHVYAHGVTHAGTATSVGHVIALAPRSAHTEINKISNISAANFREAAAFRG